MTEGQDRVLRDVVDTYRNSGEFTSEQIERAVRHVARKHNPPFIQSDIDAFIDENVYGV